VEDEDEGLDGRATLLLAGGGSTRGDNSTTRHGPGGCPGGSPRRAEHYRDREVSTSEALERVPAPVSNMFFEFMRTRNADTGKQILTELNAVYLRALAESDKLAAVCEDRSDELATEVRSARHYFVDIEKQMTRLRDRMTSMQNSMDVSLAQVEAIREDFEEHRSLCSRTREQQRKLEVLLTNDLPLARNLVSESSASCRASASGRPPAFVSCSMPNNEFLVTFKSSSLRALLAKFSGITEHIVDVAIDRSLRGASSSGSAALLELVHRSKRQLRGSAAGKRQAGRAVGRTRRGLRQHRRHRHRVALLQKRGQLRSLPMHWCMDVDAVPTCEAFSDNMATMLGSVDDIILESRIRAHEEEKHCSTSLESYGSEVRALKTKADDAMIAQANSAADHSQLMTLRRSLRRQLEYATREKKRHAADCSQQLTDLETTMHGTKKLRKELGTSVQGAFADDCVVSEWVRGPCSVDCGSEGGTQNLTRKVLDAPDLNAVCPPLTSVHVCNKKPCPVDGRMDYWQPWSDCSRACGGGTRTRRRKMLRQAAHGGMPTAETMQEEVCNMQPCDQDCQLSGWTEWTDCNKACDGGHHTRTRSVSVPILGEGSCPSESSDLRMEHKRCNNTACTTTQKCNSTIDLALVVDSSGSVGSANFDRAKEFLQALVARIEFGEASGARVALINYGSDAKIIHKLSSDAAAVLASVSTTQWLKTNTNTKRALALAGKLLDRQEDRSALRAVVVITDGMPISAQLAGKEAERLKASGGKRGTRLAFLAVGQGVSRRVLEKWASGPFKDNLLSAISYDALDDAKATELLATLCPSFTAA